MILNGIAVNSATVINKTTGKTVAVISDQSLQADNDHVIFTRPVVVDTSENMIAKVGDYLYYENTPEELYYVLSSDPSYFQMVKVKLEGEDQHLAIEGEKMRTYPNNKYIGTLQDYGLVKLT